MVLIKSKIDKLARKKKLLILAKENCRLKSDERNSVRETKIKKLENKAFHDREMAEKKIIEFNRQIEKVDREIESEQIYVNSVADSEKRKV